MVLGVIGGTGLETLPIFYSAVQEDIATPYGEVSLYKTEYKGVELCFLPRHGLMHSVPPHLINYRANIAALSKVKAKQVLSFCSVGSMVESILPGSLVLMEQFVDATWGREHTFLEIGSVGHVEMTHPYCPRLSALSKEAAAANGIKLTTGGVYYCTQGPRFETPAEISFYAALGCTVVGMTSVPETPLAREAGLCLASIGVVGNYAAGLTSKIDSADVTVKTRAAEYKVCAIIESVAAVLTEERNCDCAEAGFISF